MLLSGAGSLGGIPIDLREEFREVQNEDGSGLSLPDLMRSLRIALFSLPKVFICINALDECLPKSLPELLESLRFPRARIFLTRRPQMRGVSPSGTKTLAPMQWAPYYRQQYQQPTRSEHDYHLEWRKY